MKQTVYGGQFCDLWRFENDLKIFDKPEKQTKKQMALRVKYGGIYMELACQMLRIQIQIFTVLCHQGSKNKKLRRE